jgi:hypothetical protein
MTKRKTPRRPRIIMKTGARIANVSYDEKVVFIGDRWFRPNEARLIAEKICLMADWIESKRKKP